jgi:phage terminase large subunit-like protein
MRQESGTKKVSFLVFFLMWAERMRWDVPLIHVQACHWLENRGDVGVLRCFRGFGKSTILDIYNAWMLYTNPHEQILHQGSTDPDAYKVSRGTERVLEMHPLCVDCRKTRGETQRWWVNGTDDVRYGSLYARGIMSTVTGHRATEIQNDDVEVPQNIGTPEAREKLRIRLDEQVHIMIPGGRTLYIGTPHAHDSLYDEVERAGADCLTIRMFQKEHRIENADKKEYSLPFAPEFVFLGIGPQTKSLAVGKDYQLIIKGSTVKIKFSEAPNSLIDFYSGSAWPERFDAKEMLKRRKKTRTINSWDSQYQLHSRPVTETRLDPERMPAYDCEPVLKKANGSASMWLGKTQIVGMSVRWDPSGGKVDSDASSVAVVLQDVHGRRYWHRAERLSGDIATFAEDGKTITGGQVFQLCDIVQSLHAPKVTVETNGIGGFAPAVLKAALKQRKLTCGVSEQASVANKQRRILEAMEPLLLSGMLWAHVSVHEGEAVDQMKNFNPLARSQADDDIDAVSAAIIDTPERIQSHKHNDKNLTPYEGQNWQHNAGVFDVALEL